MIGVGRLRGAGPLQRVVSPTRQEFEQLHQAWPWSGLARVDPTTPTCAMRLADASVDPTDARKATIRGFGRRDLGAPPGDRAHLPAGLKEPRTSESRYAPPVTSGA